jgi:hypothetical protein
VHYSSRTAAETARALSDSCYKKPNDRSHGRSQDGSVQVGPGTSGSGQVRGPYTRPRYSMYRGSINIHFRIHTGS